MTGDKKVVLSNDDICWWKLAPSSPIKMYIKAFCLSECISLAAASLSVVAWLIPESSNMSMTSASNQPLPSSCCSNPQMSGQVKGVLEAPFWVGVASWIVPHEGFLAVWSRLRQWQRSVWVVQNWSDTHKAAAVTQDTGNESLLPQTSRLGVKVKVRMSITSQRTGNLFSTFNLFGTVVLIHYCGIKSFVRPFKSLWHDLVRGSSLQLPSARVDTPPTHLAHKVNPCVLWLNRQFYSLLAHLNLNV